MLRDAYWRPRHDTCATLLVLALLSLLSLPPCLDLPGKLQTLRLQIILLLVVQTHGSVGHSLERGSVRLLRVHLCLAQELVSEVRLPGLGAPCRLAAWTFQSQHLGTVSCDNGLLIFWAEVRRIGRARAVQHLL